MFQLSLESLFSVAGTLAMLGWLLLAFTPHRFNLTRTIAVVIALLLAMLYCALFAAFSGKGNGGNFGSLAGVALLFANPGVLLAGWVHYLAFDLLVGLWEREEAARIGLPRWWLIPCLFLTFMLGPMGWLLFMALRFYRVRTQPAMAA